MKEVSKYIIQFIKQHFINKKKSPPLSDSSKQFVIQLYNHINRKYIVYDELKNQVKYLQSNNVKGWLILKALSILQKK